MNFLPVSQISMLLLLLLLAGCSKTERELIESSPDKKIQVAVNAVKPSALDPFTVNITTTGKGFKESFSTEVYSGDISNENTKFEWEGNNICHITFAQQDNTTRKIYIEVTSESINVREESDPG